MMRQFVAVLTFVATSVAPTGVHEAPQGEMPFRVEQAYRVYRTGERGFELTLRTIRPIARYRLTILWEPKWEPKPEASEPLRVRISVGIALNGKPRPIADGGPIARLRIDPGGTVTQLQGLWVDTPPVGLDTARLIVAFAGETFDAFRLLGVTALSVVLEGWILGQEQPQRLELAVPLAPMMGARPDPMGEHLQPPVRGRSMARTQRRGGAYPHRNRAGGGNA